MGSTKLSTSARIKAVVEQMFPGATIAHDHYGGLLADFWESGLATPHLLKEIECGDEGKFWSYTWEAMLFRHLSFIGCCFDRRALRKSEQAGPDFGIVHKGKTIWIEAVVPEPKGIPSDYLEPPRRPTGDSIDLEMRTVPHEAIQLRLLSVVADKQRKIAEYIAAGTIAKDECTVIAVNACRLSGTNIFDQGLSQLPLIVETVFPIGPLAVPLSTDTRLPDGDPVRLPRYSIPKKSGVHVPTTTFLNPDCAHVSAAMGCVRKHMLDHVGQPTNDLCLTLVHNPLAANALPRAILAAAREFVADEQGPDTFLVHPLNE